MLFLVSPVVVDNPDTLVAPYVEWRERLDQTQNPTFSTAAQKNGSNVYTRVRAGSDFIFAPRITGRFEYQYSHDLFFSDAANGSKDASDVSLGYLKYSGDAFTLTAGRQKIDWGNQRLIGSSDWTMLGRSFDGARLQFGKLDIFAATVGVDGNRTPEARVGGIACANRLGTTQVIIKHDRAAGGSVDVQTLDHSLTASFGRFNLDAEGAVQTGKNQGTDQKAWAYHVGVGTDFVLGTTLKVEYNAASGGGDANTTRTFDNLYPTNHDQYGLSDLTGWKNVNDFAVKLEKANVHGISLKAEYHNLSLRDASDAWYNAAGGVNVGENGNLVDPTGASGRDLGQEFDLSASYGLGKGTLSAGFSYFKPGNFTQAVGGFSDARKFGYIQFQVRF